MPVCGERKPDDDFGESEQQELRGLPVWNEAEQVQEDDGDSANEKRRHHYGNPER